MISIKRFIEKRIKPNIEIFISKDDLIYKRLLQYLRHDEQKYYDNETFIKIREFLMLYKDHNITEADIKSITYHLHPIAINHNISFKIPFFVQLPHFDVNIKYSSSKHKHRLTHHFGQRKLCLSEIELLNLVYLKHPKNKINVVYPGAADGEHIMLFTKLYPNIEWFLYDPRSFFKTLYKNNKIHIFSGEKFEDTTSQSNTDGFFTDEVAAYYKNMSNSPKYKDDIFVLISDVRTGQKNLSDENEEENEEFILSDMYMQMEWVKIMEPDYTLFKFRLPYITPRILRGAGNIRIYEKDSQFFIRYLTGDILLQTRHGPTSTESRLLIDKSKHGITEKEYNATSYDSDIFIFNQGIRHECMFYNPFAYDQGGVKGFCHCWDCVRDIGIIILYIKLANSILFDKKSFNIEYKNYDDLYNQIIFGDITKEELISITILSQSIDKYSSKTTSIIHREKDIIRLLSHWVPPKKID